MPDTKIEAVRRKLAQITMSTPDAILNIMIKRSLAQQNKKPQEAKEVAQRMLNATTKMNGDVEIRYTLLSIGDVGKFLLANTKEGHIRYLDKKNDGAEIRKLRSEIADYEHCVKNNITPPHDPPVLVKIMMSKAVFLGLYHNIVDAETAWYHGEIITEGDTWLFHSLVILNTFDIFRKTLGLPDVESGETLNTDAAVPGVERREGGGNTNDGEKRKLAHV